MEVLNAIFQKNRPAQIVFILLGLTCVIGISYRTWFASLLNMILSNCGLQTIAPFYNEEILGTLVTLAGMLITAMGIAIGGAQYSDYKRECRMKDYTGSESIVSKKIRKEQNNGPRS